jgi:hypothetical protein
LGWSAKLFLSGSICSLNAGQHVDLLCAAFAMLPPLQLGSFDVGCLCGIPGERKVVLLSQSAVLCPQGWHRADQMLDLGPRTAAIETRRALYPLGCSMILPASGKHDYGGDYDPLYHQSLVARRRAAGEDHVTNARRQNRWKCATVVDQPATSNRRPLKFHAALAVRIDERTWDRGAVMSRH